VENDSISELIERVQRMEQEAEEILKMTRKLMDLMARDTEKIAELTAENERLKKELAEKG